MLHDRLPDFVRHHYEVHEWRHASAILASDYPAEWRDILDVLGAFRLRKSWIATGGGSKSKVSGFIDDFLYERGWIEKKFETGVLLDGVRLDSPTHQIDCYRNKVALEIEWNNKDPFFDRDLENFQRLHAQSAISVGVLITRGASLQDNMLGIVQRCIEKHGFIDESEMVERFNMKERTRRQADAVKKLVDRQVPFAEAFSRQFVSDKFGQATTHWRKLEDRINRGVGNPCPLLLIGLPASVVAE